MAVDGDGFPGQGMGQGELVGMEHEAPLGVGMVEGITHQRSTMMGQMNPDLVGASSFQLTSHQGLLAVVGLRVDLGEGCLAVFGVNDPLSAVVAVATNLVRDGHRLGQSAVNQG